MWLLSADFGNYVRYAPLYIISVKLNTVSCCREAERYQLVESCEGLLPHERLRWCRYRAGLLQREVATRVGISRSVYMDMENGLIDYWPKEIVDKLAELFHILPEKLLDAYQFFLYTGQERNIENMRRAMGMAKRPFARHLGVNRSLLQKWILGKTRISKKAWEKYFSQMPQLKK